MQSSDKILSETSSEKRAEFHYVTMIFPNGLLEKLFLRVAEMSEPKLKIPSVYVYGRIISQLVTLSK